MVGCFFEVPNMAAFDSMIAMIIPEAAKLQP
jgi:hypothetical protein